VAGFAQAARNGKSGETLAVPAREEAIDTARRALTAALMKAFAVQPTPQPHKPLRAGMGRIAHPGHRNWAGSCARRPGGVPTGPPRNRLVRNRGYGASPTAVPRTPISPKKCAANSYLPVVVCSEHRRRRAASVFGWV